MKALINYANMAAPRQRVEVSDASIEGHFDGVPQSNYYPAIDL